MSFTSSFVSFCDTFLLQSFAIIFIISIWCWGLNPELQACRTHALPLSSRPSPYF
jgi:hypothetical protein